MTKQEILEMLEEARTEVNELNRKEEEGSKREAEIEEVYQNISEAISNLEDID